MQSKLAAAIQAGIMSAPSLVALPAGVPFAAAIVTVALPEGCRPPPGPLGRRVASGCGETREAAAFTALVEGAERYSLQYSSKRPTEYLPWQVCGGAHDPVRADTVLLGAPGVEPADTRGAAAGQTLEAAADTALLEWLEHHHLERAAAGDSEFTQLPPDRIPALAKITEFLDHQMRILSLQLLQKPGYVVVRVVSSDRTGARPVTGAAAGTELNRTALRATLEAVLLWRNMVEIERTGAIPGNPRDLAILRLYRGADSLPEFPVSGAAISIEQVEAPQPLIQTVADLRGAPVRILDMTAPELGVPVVRVV